MGYQKLYLPTICGAFALGLLLPLRLIGYQPPFIIDCLFSLLLSSVSISAIIIRLYNMERSERFKVKTWLGLGTLIDLVCAIPFGLLIFSLNDQPIPLQLVFLSLLSVRHISLIKSYLDQMDSLQPIVFRLVPLALMMPILVHLVACGWILLGSGTSGTDPDYVFNYIKAVYWAFTTLTTVGYGDISAKTAPQMLYACVIQVAGVGIFGFVISNVASLLGRLDAAREHHMDNLDKIETFMKMHTIPPNMRAKARSYFHYLWIHKKGYSDRSLLTDLPAKLQSELLLFMNKNIIEKVPFLKEASPEMIEDLMDKLESRIFVPSERIFKIDEPGDALYFIQSGEVKILGRDKNTIATLKDGAFFGEMALLSDRPRSATAMASEYCDIFVLHKESFVSVMQAYPEFKDHIEKVINQRRAS